MWLRAIAHDRPPARSTQRRICSRGDVERWMVGRLTNTSSVVLMDQSSAVSDRLLRPSPPKGGTAPSPRPQPGHTTYLGNCWVTYDLPSPVADSKLCLMARGVSTTAEIEWSSRLGAHAEAARLRAGMRRSALAAKLRVSEETVRLWERGSVQPSPDNLARLIVVLAIDAVQWTKTESQPPEAPPMARRLRQERQGRGITQAEVGRLLGVPQPTYAGWETGRSTPSAHFFASLARFLAIPEPDVAALCASPYVVDASGWPPLGKLMGAKRQELRLTRALLADVIGVAASTIVAWEHGYRVPPPNQLRRLADVLKVDVDTLTDAIPRRGSPTTTLGELILERQRELGLRLVDVAERAGATEATVSRWVHGRNKPAASSLQRLADALELPFTDVARAAGYAA
ncbi:MAG: helix-turn-helix domain protein [Acidimicrobiales bacterium]|jgi:transcriptional regulator with XRE-family HTH domain|nr:helix-turn-helix domain protein [Acidimicrobiales bacterium]